MLNNILFLLIVLISNIIQGITGFAGTIIAMPFSIIFVGFDTAKPILNALGLLAGLYIVSLSHKNINKREFYNAIWVMLLGTVLGTFIKNFILDSEKILSVIFGLVVIAIAITGMAETIKKKSKKHNRLVSFVLLVSAGIVQGMFVSGGPLLVSYMTGKISEKNQFRSTLSAIWIATNSVILFSDINMGYWSFDTIKIFIPCVVVLFIGMLIGHFLYKKMSRELFMKITYGLLLISGISLILK